MFRDKIRHMVEVYIDDMVVKASKKYSILRIFRGCLQCFGIISYALMWRNVLLG